jgi:GNAT superfamily N-acetyltransferase
MSIATHTANDRADTRRERDVGLRAIEPGDHEAAARITYEAFAGIHDRHRFPRDFPTLDVARGLVAAFSTHPSIWGVVAESGGRVVGSNFLDERGPIRGVGPITVDPDAQAAGVGRLLMEAVIERGARADGIRLLQDSFNTASLALYSSLGFRVEEPVALMAGTPSVRPRRGVEVRPLVEDDIPACEELCLFVHGFERTRELRDVLAAPAFNPYVALRGSRIVAYAATLDGVRRRLRGRRVGGGHVSRDRRGGCARRPAGVVPAPAPPARPAALVPGRGPADREAHELHGHGPQGAWIPSVLY